MSFGDTEQNKEIEQKKHKKSLSQRDLILIIVFGIIVFLILLILGAWKYKKYKAFNGKSLNSRVTDRVGEYAYRKFK